MVYDITASTIEINLSPKTTAEEVVQNIAILLATPKLSVPLDRGLGLQQSFLDKPQPIAAAIMAADVIEAVREYEPRADITNVWFEQGDTGEIKTHVEVAIDE